MSNEIEIYCRPQESPAHIFKNGNDVRIYYCNQWIDFRDGLIRVSNEAGDKVALLSEYEHKIR